MANVSQLLTAPWAMAAVVVLFASPAKAPFTCYDETALPAVSRLERRGDGLYVLLGPKWWRGGWDDARAPALSYDPREGWALAGEAPVRRVGEPPACASQLPLISLSVEQAILLRPHVGNVPEDVRRIDQRIGACQRTGDVIWFGIAFYDGEGSEGVGGVGRYDLETKQLEIHRPGELRDASVSHLVHDGDSLWLATRGNYECAGDPPVSGLIEYKWEKRKATTQWLCGLVYHGMILVDGDLWVASDLGLARGRRNEHGYRDWENFVPTPTGSDPLAKVECDELYTELLDSLSTEELAPGDPSPWSMLFKNLQKLHPRFIEAYMLEKRKQSRTDPSDPSEP